MLYIIDNNLLNIDNPLYDLFKNCIKKLNIDIVNILIIEYDKYYYYKNYNYRNNKLSIYMVTKYDIDYENMHNIIRNTEIYCFYQEKFDNFYESILFNYYENYFNQELKNISIIYMSKNISKHSYGLYPIIALQTNWIPSTCNKIDQYSYIDKEKFTLSMSHITSNTTKNKNPVVILLIVIILIIILVIILIVIIIKIFRFYG